MRKILMLVALALAACRQARFGPVELNAEDMCAYCRMAISEQRCAAQFIDKEGTPFKFDDIRCLSRYISERRHDRATVAAFFVADFETKEWVRAESAHYVRSPEFKTPMGGGIRAYKDAAAAESPAAAHHGELMSFRDLFE